jgi:hypothetical protein
MTVIISTTDALALANLLADALDGGKFEIYSGAKPANPQTAITTQTKLAEGTFPTPAFGNAAMSGVVAVAAANAIADLTGLATNTATWVRVKDSGGVARFDGSVSAPGGGGDMTITTVNISTGVTIIVISFNIRVPTGQ